MTHNQIDWHNAKETEKHNRAMEGETSRHNVETERLQQMANALQEALNVINREHYERADRINEEHYIRADANAAEANAINRYNAQLRAQEIYGQLDLGYKQQQETARHNAQVEAISRQQNAINQQLALETKRHNSNVEQLTLTYNNSLIAKNAAETSYVGANTKYIQAQTKTEAERTQTQRQLTIKERYLGEVAGYQSIMERSNAALADDYAVSGVIRNYSGVINGAINSVASLAR